MWEEPLISQCVAHPWWDNSWLRRPTFAFKWQNVARVRLLGQTTRSPGRGRKCPKTKDVSHRSVLSDRLLADSSRPMQIWTCRTVVRHGMAR